MPNLRTHGTWVYRRSVEVRGHSYSVFEDSDILLKSLLVVQIEKKKTVLYYIFKCASNLGLMEATFYNFWRSVDIIDDK